ncbi:MAG: response regulator [Planctomycetota bacterium]
MSKILIVDDSTTMRQQVKQAIAADGYEIAEAADGQEALELLRGDTTVKVVVLDVNMPRMNGIELIEALKEEGRMDSGLQVVMLTTEGHAELIGRAKAAGAKGWIVKPFKAEMLAAAVKKMAA